MKKISAVLLMSLVSIVGYSQIEKIDKHPFDLTLLATDSLEQISRIDKEVALINNNLKSFKKVEKSKDKDGYRYEYFKGDERKMIHILYKDTVPDTDKDVKWYFHNGHVIYSEKVWTYPKHKNMVASQDKCYLVNDNLIGWIRLDNKPVDGSSSEFKDFAKQIKDYALKLEKEKP